MLVIEPYYLYVYINSIHGIIYKINSNICIIFRILYKICISKCFPKFSHLVCCICTLPSKSPGSFGDAQDPLLFLIVPFSHRELPLPIIHSLAKRAIWGSNLHGKERIFPLYSHYHSNYPIGQVHRISRNKGLSDVWSWASLAETVAASAKVLPWPVWPSQRQFPTSWLVCLFLTFWWFFGICCSQLCLPTLHWVCGNLGPSSFRYQESATTAFSQ